MASCTFDYKQLYVQSKMLELMTHLNRLGEERSGVCPGIARITYGTLELVHFVGAGYVLVRVLFVGDLRIRRGFAVGTGSGFGRRRRGLSRRCLSGRVTGSAESFVCQEAENGDRKFGVVTRPPRRFQRRSWATRERAAGE